MANCRKCSAVLTEDCIELRNGVYGCDTGCEYVTLEIECPCGDEFEAGTFGCFENDAEEKELLEELMEGYFEKSGSKA